MWLFLAIMVFVYVACCLTVPLMVVAARYELSLWVALERLYRSIRTAWFFRNSPLLRRHFMKRIFMEDDHGGQRYND